MGNIWLQRTLVPQQVNEYHCISQNVSKNQRWRRLEMKTVKNDRDILIIKAKSFIKRDKMKEMYRNLLEQKQCGIILLDDTFDVMIAKDVIFSLEDKE